MRTLYHGTFRVNLPSIALRGLLPHDPGFYIDDGAEPEAVFLAEDVGHAYEVYLEKIGEWTVIDDALQECWDREWVVLCVDCEGLLIESAAVHDGAYLYRSSRLPIGPERLTFLNGRPLTLDEEVDQ